MVFQARDRRCWLLTREEAEGEALGKWITGAFRWTGCACGVVCVGVWWVRWCVGVCGDMCACV